MVALSALESLKLLGSCEVGRIVYTDGALPAVTPVNYAYDDGHVYIRTTAVSQLVRKVPNTIVAFEVDEVDRKARHGWSVVATGPCEIVTDPDTLEHVATLDLEPWAAGDRNVVLQISTAIVTGYEIARGTPSVTETGQPGH
jgi:nitroimidazol reductase NimA-like FMN-containing flavoprotein (pyridoxamine 5'-phosphate oxidase superfamily)